MNRETWLNLLADKMAPKFDELGWPLQPFRVSIGFTSAGKVSNIGGECWHKSRSADGKFEILIAPHQSDVMTVAAILAHELTHAAVGFQHKHKGDFAKCMAALGMLRPFTSSIPGDAFKEWVQPFLNELGALPHAALQFSTTAMVPREPRQDGEEGQEDGDNEGGSSNARPKQKTRLLKACCRECGYTVRVTLKWVDQAGAPHCPNHGAMDVDAGAMADAPKEDA